MAHEIFGERFFSRRVPAWHGLGLVLNEDIGATEAFKRIGEYTVSLEPVTVGTGADASGFRAIVRSETPKGGPAAVLNVVTADYNPIGTHETCAIFDRAVNRPVETIGSLRNGAYLFMTTKLPKFDIAGDEIDDYLIVVNPMDGKEASHILRTPTRVVCMNTLRMGQSLSAERYNLRHGADVAKQLEEWLSGMYVKALANTAKIKTAGEILAAHYPTDEILKVWLAEIYPEPRAVRQTAPTIVLQKREEHRQYVREHQLSHREQVQRLFRDGTGTGMNTPAARNTAWGFYNAVTEYEDCRWSRNPQRALESAVFGARANVKEAAFDTIYASVTK